MVACGPEITPRAIVPEETATPAVATQKPFASPEPTLQPAATFEKVPCPFALPEGQVEGKTVECGYLTVPENRDDPQSRKIRLAVAIFRHPSGNPRPDPIIYLTGGPGGSILKIVSLTGFEAQFGPMFAANRDIILFDQRGVGFSQPALDCPQFTKLYLDLLDHEVDGVRLTAEEGLARNVEALAACAKELSTIADLSAYNTAASAADVNDLRIALGYDKVNLWGGSYGTRLALGVMRDFPQGLRSVVLEAVYPPDVDLFLDTPADFDRALNLVIVGCAADKACNAAYPNLRAVLSDTVKRLNENPASVELIHPFTRERYAVLLRGDDLVEQLFRSLYIPQVRPMLPQIIYDASKGTFDTLLLVAREFLWKRDIRSWGMCFSVLCHEEMPFSSPEAYQAVLARYPEYAGFLAGSEVGGLTYAICPRWGAGEADALENQPVTSDIPTLIMAGEYDPITPPEWARRVASGLKNGYLFVYPGMGHGASGDDCARKVMLAFLEDPSKAPDAACIATMEVSPFAVPAQSAEVVLKPFTSQEKGLRGLAPEGWREVRPGVFARASSGVDQTALIHDVVPMKAEALLSALAKQFGLPQPPEAVSKRDANGLSWSLYTLEVQGFSIDIALAEHGDKTLAVLLQGARAERDALYKTVFLPAVDALALLE
jgi:pimeloyl-ACP methyl ester carboxylesterase